MPTWEKGEVSETLRGAAYKGAFAEHNTTITADASTPDSIYSSGGPGFDPNAPAGP